MEQATNPQDVSPQPTETKSETQSKSAADILKRSQEVKKEEPSKEQPEKVSDIPDSLITSEQYASIKDPVSRQKLKELEKNAIKGMHEKFREAAERTKLAEEKERKAQELIEKAQNPQWTEDTFEKMLQDPKFIEFAQAKVASQQTQTPPSNYDGSQEEWSALSDAEQQRIKSLEDKINTYMTQQERLKIQNADKEIAERLPGYDSSLVDKFQNELMQNKYDQAAIREHIGKSLLFEQAVQRAYHAGLEDRKLELGEKSNASQQLNGHNTQTQRDVPEPMVNERTGKKEPSAKHFARIALQNLAGMGKN